MLKMTNNYSPNLDAHTQTGDSKAKVNIRNTLIRQREGEEEKEHGLNSKI